MKPFTIRRHVRVQCVKNEYLKVILLPPLILGELNFWTHWQKKIEKLVDIQFYEFLEVGNFMDANQLAVRSNHGTILLYPKIADELYQSMVIGKVSMYAIVSLPKDF